MANTNPRIKKPVVKTPSVDGSKAKPIVKKSIATKLGELYGKAKAAVKSSPSAASSVPPTPAAATTPKPKFTIKGGQVTPKGTAKTATPAAATNTPKPSAPKATPSQAKGKLPDWYVQNRAAAKAAAAKATTPVTQSTAKAAPKAAPKAVATAATTAAKQSVGTNLGKAASKLKGKGKYGLIGAGLLAAGVGAKSLYDNYKSSTSKKSAPSKSSSSDFNKGKDPIQQFGVKQSSTPTVLKKDTAPKRVTEYKSSSGPKRSSTSTVKKPVSFSPGIKSPSSFKSIDTKLKTNISAPKSLGDMPRSSSSESATSSRSSASKGVKRLVNKGKRIAGRIEKKAGRTANKESRITNRIGRLTSKLKK
jgi:hypothetical protein